MITSSSPSLNGPLQHRQKVQADTLLANYLDAQRGCPSFRRRASAARHFLHWLRRDALLAYIEQVRPAVQEDRVFLRIHAPFRPLASSAEIARIVAKARGRAGVEGGPTGAHVFRHSLATAMVRTGSSLESIGAVLRHRSPVTTAIYAKVDVAMLARVAQPWPGDASC
jgi:integrase